MGAKHSNTSEENNVQVVNIKRREENQAVYAEETPTGQQQPVRTISTSATDNTPDRQRDKPTTDDTSKSVMIETVVGNVDDFNDGQMQEVQIGEKKVLLVREAGQFYAISNKCTHYAVPLVKGVYCKGVVRCMAHGACFNIKTGDIEDFPGLDSLQTFQVEVENDKVVVKADPAALETHKRIRPMVKRVAGNKQTVLLVGGGPASVVCAETLRQEGYTGCIVLVTQENCLPYEKIKLSKAMSSKPEDIALRTQDFYDMYGIELKLGKKVTSVSTGTNQVTLDDGTRISYNTLVLATGGQPRRLSVPGMDLDNLYMLGIPSDANAIAEKSKGKNLVIVGSSFIGLEVAASMVRDVASVTVVGHSAVPLAHVFGSQIGQWFQKIHESKGVKFQLGTSVKEFKGENGKVTEAVLDNGTVLPADVCVLGVGVIPTTDFLKDSGLTLTSRRFLEVNKKMQTNVPNVYGAGDAVEFPLFTVDDSHVNVQHWQMAHKHGRIAGLNIAGKPEDIRSVPYFWTVQYGKSVRYTGYGPGNDDVVLHGNTEENKFVAYYTKGEYVVAVASVGWDPIVAQAAELMLHGGRISKEEIKSDPESWLPRLLKL